MEENYVKLEKLGSGSYGAVYKARGMTSNTFVALKKVNLNLLDSGFPRHYLREISLLQSLQHENIVEYKSIIWGNCDHIYLVFELMMCDMQIYIEECEPDGIRLTALRNYFYQMIKGLEYCHKRATLHRDVKPENILIDHRGVIKIADFGLGRTISVPLPKYTANVVTLWYRAPELLLGLEKYAYPIDIWAMGCIFAEMISGQPLFCGDSEIDQICKIFNVLDTPKDDIWPGVTQLPYYKDASPVLKDVGLGKRILLRGSGFELLEMMLVYNPLKRISAKKILKHKYFNCFDPKKLYPPLPKLNALGQSLITNS